MSDLDNSFDDWFYSNYLTSLDDFDGLDIRAAFDAGQQSKQKEIDELQSEIEGYKKIYGELEVQKNKLNTELNLTIKRLITSEEDIARGCKHWRESFLELDNSMREAIEIGQKNKQDEIDRLNEALKYMLEQLDHPYRSCGETIEKNVNKILRKK